MASTTSNFVLHGAMPAIAATPARSARRRRVTPQAGRALEILGHAIEYLADEYVHNGGQFSASDSQVQAMRLLMNLNRSIYLDCPEIPTLGQRCFSVLGRLLN